MDYSVLPTNNKNLPSLYSNVKISSNREKRHAVHGENVCSTKVKVMTISLQHHRAEGNMIADKQVNFVRLARKFLYVPYYVDFQMPIKLKCSLNVH